MRTSTVLAGLIALCAACKGDPGPPGPEGSQGPQGPAGPVGPTGVAIGWGSDGGNVYTTLPGRVGIGTQTPTATLDVQGTLNVDEDLYLAPGQGCRNFTLSVPTGDLADQLAPILAKNRCASVMLAASTNWTWNKRVALGAGQRLYIWGEGYANGAANITVTILMTQNATFSNGGTDYREPGRLITRDGATFSLAGVNLNESSRDARPLTPSCESAALFTLNGQFATIELSQIRIVSTEDIVNLAHRAYGTLLLGHTFVDQNTSSPRSILVTNTYQGWCFGSGIMAVMRSHTTLGANVSFATPSTHILYNQ